MSCSLDCFSYVSLMSGAKSCFCFRAYFTQTRNVVSKELRLLKINFFNILFTQVAFHIIYRERKTCFLRATPWIFWRLDNLFFKKGSILEGYIFNVNILVFFNDWDFFLALRSCPLRRSGYGGRVIGGGLGSFCCPACSSWPKLH